MAPPLEQFIPCEIVRLICVISTGQIEDVMVAYNRGPFPPLLKRQGVIKLQEPRSSTPRNQYKLPGPPAFDKEPLY